jgi:ectoine hydroxylase-related dioxygenase (phytanoyl-CoA dioxygenase family)
MSLGLTPDQQRFYAENGFILLKGVFTKPEMAAMRREMHQLAERLAGHRGAWDPTWPSVRTGKTEIKHCHDVQFHSAATTRLITDPRLTAPLQSLIGPNIQLHHTKMFIKPPEKGSPFPMHQDYYYFPHERHTMMAAIIHFDDAPVAKGCVRVVPGSHKLGPLQPDGDNHDNSLPHERFPIDKATPCEAEAGDVLLFNYMTIHGSGVNVSDEARTTLLVQVRDPLDLPTVRSHESRGQGMMLAGIDPNCAALPDWEKQMAAAAAK